MNKEKRKYEHRVYSQIVAMIIHCTACGAEARVNVSLLGCGLGLNRRATGYCCGCGVRFEGGFSSTGIPFAERIS